MRKISANLILPVSSSPLKNGIIRLDNKGTILEVNDTGGNLHEEAGLEFYSGIIVPGFVLPWLSLADATDSIETLDRELIRSGVKGVGVLIPESRVDDGGLEKMARSPLIYHPIIDLQPEPDEDEFELFQRGVVLISHAWNEFNISCSLYACPHLMENSDLGRYLREYSSSHRNVSPPVEPKSIAGGKAGGRQPEPLQPLSSGKASLNILKNLHSSGSVKNFWSLLPSFTLDAAARIFEDDVLGSIEPGKQPGLNLISGLDPGPPEPGKNVTLRVLV